MNKDINLIYWGGSGGFYLLFQFLLTKQFVCYFDDIGSSESLDLKKLIKQQFSFESYKYWKKNEVWPENKSTKMLVSNKRKIYFYCSLFTGFELSATNVLLYTDYKSQLRLSKLKNAYYWLYPITIDRNFYRDAIKNSKDNLLKEVFLTKYGIEKSGGMSVKLQDAATLEGLTKFFRQLDVEITEDNIEFLRYWKQLHPPEFLKKIQIL